LQTYLDATLEKKITVETSRHEAGGMIIAHARERRKEEKKKSAEPNNTLRWD
jgi:hypothetical protein